jgi:tRNA U38,U39,U40 pseudouridine synthase TruA
MKTYFPSTNFAFKIQSQQFLYQMVLCVIISLLVDIQGCKLITQTANVYRQEKRPCEHPSIINL